MNSAELKPCPFCGAPAERPDIQGKPSWFKVFTVKCSACPAKMFSEVSQAQCDYQWNKRTVPVSKAAYHGFRLLKILDKPRDGGADE